MRSVLFIAYYFPPRVGSGVHRIVRFAKYLPQFGWHPYVLSAEPFSYEAEDRSLLADKALDSIKVVYTPRIPLDILSGQLIYAKEPNPNTGKEIDGQENSLKSTLWKIGKQIRPWIHIPDQYAGWFPYAYKAGIQILREHKIDVIFSSYMPATAHLVAWRLKKATGIPWVADFRDLWSQNGYRNDVGSLRWRVDRWLERRMLIDADAIVTVTEPWRRRMERLSVPNIASKLYTVMNGFDPDSFVELEHHTSDVFTLVYTGILYGGRRDPAVVLEAISQLVDSGYIDAERFRFIIAGPRDVSTSRLIKRYNLEGVVCQVGRLSHPQALQLQVDATALLLLQWADPRNEGVCPAKIFEYLGARRPILGLVPEGDVTARIIQQTESGVIVSPQDRKGVRQTLLDWYQVFVTRGDLPFEPNDSEIQRFSSHHRARELCTILEQVSS